MTKVMGLQLRSSRIGHFMRVSYGIPDGRLGRLTSSQACSSGVPSPKSAKHTAGSLRLFIGGNGGLLHPRDCASVRQDVSQKEAAFPPQL